MEHLIGGSQQKLDMRHLRYLVVDEADGMYLPRESWLQLVETLAHCKSTPVKETCCRPIRQPDNLQKSHGLVEKHEVAKDFGVGHLVAGP